MLEDDLIASGELVVLGKVQSATEVRPRERLGESTYRFDVKPSLVRNEVSPGSESSSLISAMDRLGEPFDEAGESLIRCTGPILSISVDTWPDLDGVDHRPGG